MSDDTFHSIIKRFYHNQTNMIIVIIIIMAVMNYAMFTPSMKPTLTRWGGLSN